jgi:prepilin-type N-terminal cleavage/methylation domain-containing protein
MRQNTFKTGLSSRAFTMLELVFVIVVLGILAAMAIPRLEQDHRQEAADHILSNIRYTQHFALNDDKHDYNSTNSANSAKWQRRFWTIAFSTCSDGTDFFRIGTDDDGSSGSAGVFEANEYATDPFNGKRLGTTNGGDCDAAGVSENIKIGKKYGINTVTGANGCAGVQHIGFDHLGRPHVGFGNSAVPNHASYMSQRCTFTFDMDNGDQFLIHIEPETGYAWIDGQPQS